MSTKSQTTDLVERLWASDAASALTNEAAREIERLRGIIERARILVALVTVGMVVEAGDEEIEAAGLNPWCINEGRATGDEPIDTYWMEQTSDE